MRSIRDPYRPSEEMPKGRTLKQIVIEDYNGDVADACHALGIYDEYEIVNKILRGAPALPYKQGMRRIAAIIGEPVETLFPDSLYQKFPLFRTIQDTPGYQRIAEKWQIVFDSHGNSLRNLLRGKAFTDTGMTRFMNLLRGILPVWGALDFCQNVAENLQMDIQELFPISLYDYANDEGFALSGKSPLLEDGMETQERLTSACELSASIATESAHEIRARIVGELLEQLTKTERALLHARFGFERKEGETLHKLAENLDTPRSTIASRQKRILRRLRTLMNDARFEDDLRLLRELDKRDPRVKI
jgi:hypothetical protein